jgi:hypothetical protein
MSINLSEVRFRGFEKPITHNNHPQKMAPGQPNKLLRQPPVDEVAFKGAVLDLRKISKVAKALNLSLSKGHGNHGTHLVGKIPAHVATKIGIQPQAVNIPIPVHGGGKDIATGTANSIAKELGFDNVRKMLQSLKV